MTMMLSLRNKSLFLQKINYINYILYLAIMNQKLDFEPIELNELDGVLGGTARMSGCIITNGKCNEGGCGICNGHCGPDTISKPSENIPE